MHIRIMQLDLEYEIDTDIQQTLYNPHYNSINNSFSENSLDSPQMQNE